MEKEEYLSHPEWFVKEISFNDHGKIRNIVTYDTQEGKYGRELQKEHEEILGLLEALPSSEHSYAYKKGVRLLDAVEPHVGNATFLKLDIKGYFDHIDPALLAEKLVGYTPTDPKDLLPFCTYKGKVPIGFVTSPRLSDFYLYGLDLAIEDYIRDHPGLTCSRYADDFLLSSPVQDFDEVLGLGDFIREELKKYHLQLNEEKTVKSKLGKQTSVRFLGLNIGKDKVTLSKWYILKTLNAFRRYHIARYNKDEAANEYKSIAFGLYNFIVQNSPSSKERFLRKYENAFHKKFPALLPEKVEEKNVVYTLDENKETYTAEITVKEGDSYPTGLYIRSHIGGADVVKVVSKSCYEGLSKLEHIQLPRTLKLFNVPFYNMESLKENPLLGVVSQGLLKPKKALEEYSSVREIGVLRPSCDEYDYNERIYLVRKAEGGYRAEEVQYASWSVVGFPRFTETRSRFVPSSIEADRLFCYFAEQVKENKYPYKFGRHAYIKEGDKKLLSPIISIPLLVALQFFFDDIVRESTKFMIGKQVGSLEKNQKEIKAHQPSEDCFYTSLPIDEETQIQISLRLDFSRLEKEYEHTHILVNASNPEKPFTVESSWNALKDERAKALLLQYAKELEGNKAGAFAFTYQGKTYYADRIKTSFYHLLQYLSPIEFVLEERYLIDDGVGEYLFLGPGRDAVKAREFAGCSSLRVVRISDSLDGHKPVNVHAMPNSVDDEAFKDCVNLEKVYISALFYAYRNEDRMKFGKDVFANCEKLGGSIVLFPSEDRDYVHIDEEGLVKPNDPIEIEILSEEDFGKLDTLPPHAKIDVRAHSSVYMKAMGLLNRLQEERVIASYILRHRQGPLPKGATIKETPNEGTGIAPDGKKPDFDGDGMDELDENDLPF